MTFTFNREALLLDELNGSIEERWAVVNIEAHELAHQWTGNLVTLKWSDITIKCLWRIEYWEY